MYRSEIVLQVLEEDHIYTFRIKLHYYIKDLVCIMIALVVDMVQQCIFRVFHLRIAFSSLEMSLLIVAHRTNWEVECI